MKLLAEPVEIVIEVNGDRLAWPEEGVVAAGEGSNRSFADLSGARWSDLDEVLRVEWRCVEHCAQSASGPEEFWQMLEERSDDVSEELHEFDPGVDLGVMAAVVALNAARCPTLISCVGHGREPAHVNFWARPQRVRLLVEAAEAAGVGLFDVDGLLAVNSDEAMGLLRFGKELRGRSAAFRALRTPLPSPRWDDDSRPGFENTGNDNEQLELTFDVRPRPRE